jgi:hypothetical protein
VAARGLDSRQPLGLMLERMRLDVEPEGSQGRPPSVLAATLWFTKVSEPAESGTGVRSCDALLKHRTQKWICTFGIISMLSP